jgi:splicing factor 3A subunit 1
MASVPNGTSAVQPAAAANAAMEVDSEEPSAKAIGIIQPPPDIKNIVDKTAAFVAKNGPQFEQRILTNEKNTTKFGFLQPHSPYYPYYQKKLQECRLSSGQPAPAAAPAAQKDDKAENKDAAKAEQASEAKKDASATIEAKASVDSMKKRRPLKQPPADVYTVLPPEGLLIPTLDLDIIKLTAQYVALNGRSFLNGLLTRENRNPQFDFLKGHHYLFGYFTALVEAYSKVFNPPEGTIERLKKDAEDRVDILERAFQKLDWEAHLEKERQMNEANAAKERETAAMIDWHDFKVMYPCLCA